MNVVFDRSFVKSINKLKNPVIKTQVKQVIFEVEKATNLNEVRNVKKMEGFKNFYRVRIGNYRIGIELENGDIIRFIIAAHRKDIYKYFP